MKSTGGEVANALVCKTSIRRFNPDPVLQLSFRSFLLNLLHSFHAQGKDHPLCRQPDDVLYHGCCTGSGGGDCLMSDPTIGGVYAAMLTPRGHDDDFDSDSFRRLLGFLLDHGVHGFEVNGATGEFCLTTPRQLDALLTQLKQETADKARILCGVGAASSSLASEFAAVAAAHGVQGILLPMPYFFPYEQQDLDSFCRAVAASTKLPVLLYNLPQFTSGLESETVRRLITEVPNIVGIKDSSGSLDILRDLTEHQVGASRIVGNDGALAAAMREGVCDGVVSGVACVLPELIGSFFAKYKQTGSEAFEHEARLLDEFIEQLNGFPTPWGLKWVAEARHVLTATFSQPLASSRLEQATRLQEWFRPWHSEYVAALQSSVVSP